MMVDLSVAIRKCLDSTPIREEQAGDERKGIRKKQEGKRKTGMSIIGT